MGNRKMLDNADATDTVLRRQSAAMVEIRPIRKREVGRQCWRELIVHAPVVLH